MAQLKLSELNAVTAKENTDLIYIARNGTSRSITVANLLSNVLVYDSNGNVTGITSDGIAEGNTRLYFTNNRAIAAVQTLVNTDGITEGIANLYFSNARAIGAFTAGQNMTIDANGLLTATFDPGTITVTADLSLNTTTDLAEGANLYYTNDRVLSFITDNISTANITEDTNLYYTNARVLSVFDSLTTSNLVEGANLYFTNTRAVGALTAGAGLILESNGLIYANSNVTYNTIDTSNINGNIFGLYGQLEEIYIRDTVGTGNIYGLITPLVVGPYDDLLLASYPGHDIVVLPNDGFGRMLVEGSLEVTGNIVGNVILSPGSINTSNVPESGNLYFTNARVVGALISGVGITIESNGMIIGGAANVDSVNGQTGTVLLTTANITESGNLYFTNTRAIGALTGSPTVVIESNGYVVASTDEIFALATTSNLIEGANLYFTNTRAVSALTGGDGITIEANGMVVSAASADSIYNGTSSITIPIANGAIVFNVDGTVDVADVNEWGLNVNANLQVTGLIEGNVNGVYSQIREMYVTDASGNVYGLMSTVVAGGGVDDFLIAGYPGHNIYMLPDNGSGNVIVDGDMTVLGNLYATLPAIEVDLGTTLEAYDGNIIPADNGNAYTLGTNTNVWAELHVSNIYIDGSLITETSGVPTIESENNINLTANDAVVISSSPLQLATFTWAEIQNIPAANGMMVYNSTNTKLQAYVNGAWVDLHS